uniref:(2Fe-2S)-binding protein n=1 Tax=Desulfococcus sp. TaxID=2025834 RepID=UPI0035931B94
RRELRYGGFLNRMCRIPAAGCLDIPDETVICRCEGVKMGDLRRQIEGGAAAVDALKKATRAGMGSCQGRICGPILSDILGALTGKGPEALGVLSARAPVRMVPLGAVADMAAPGDGIT